MCQSAGTSPFERYTLWQATLNRAAGFGPTRDSGRVRFRWQSHALVDYFSCQSHRLYDPNERPPCSHHTAAYPSFPVHHLLQQGSAQPPLVRIRSFAVITPAERLEFSRDCNDIGAWWHKVLMSTLEEYIAPSVAVLTVWGWSKIKIRDTCTEWMILPKDNIP